MFIIFRFEGVLLLQTFDAEGKISSFIGGVKSEVSPHFLDQVFTALHVVNKPI